MVTSILAFLRDKVGFKRIGLAVSVVLIGFAVYVLATKLATIDWAKVGVAIAKVGPGTLLLAGLFTVAAYATLTAYDYFATRTIGRDDIPYRTCALASITSYSIAHNLGATVFVATVVRYLVYARNGLGAPDVIKLSFIAGLTFWLGNATVLGLGFVLEPEVVAPIVSQLGIGAGFIRMIGFATLAALIGWLIFVSVPRRIGAGRWELRLPDTKRTALQMLIGIVDLSCTAAIFYVILMATPDAPQHPFTAVGVIFVAAMLLGFASHAPGAAGAFEASLLIALPAIGYQPESVVAAFILFRIYYFLLPFVVALALLALREIAAGRNPIADLKTTMATIRAAEHEQEAAEAKKGDLPKPARTPAE